MRGRRNMDKPQGNSSLPPCRVCGEPGSGFHYGVTTCGACKGFFRRSLVRKEPYVCIQSHLCHVGPSTSRRQSCPKCRYEKCRAVGMSKEACKVGRYSLLKKSKDMIELLEHRGLSPSVTPVSRDETATPHSDTNHSQMYNTRSPSLCMNPTASPSMATFDTNGSHFQNSNSCSVFGNFNLQKPDSVSFTGGEEMPWTFGSQREMFIHNSVGCSSSSDHESSDSYTGPDEDHPRTGKGTFFSDTYFVDGHYGEFLTNDCTRETIPASSFDERGVTSKPSYTNLEPSHHQHPNNTPSPWLDPNPHHRAAAMTPPGYFSSFDSANIPALTPPSTSNNIFSPVADLCFNFSSSSDSMTHVCSTLESNDEDWTRFQQSVNVSCHFDQQQQQQHQHPKVKSCYHQQEASNKLYSPPYPPSSCSMTVENEETRRQNITTPHQVKNDKDEPSINQLISQSINTDTWLDNPFLYGDINGLASTVDDPLTRNDDKHPFHSTRTPLPNTAKNTPHLAEHFMDDGCYAKSSQNKNCIYSSTSDEDDNTVILNENPLSQRTKIDREGDEEKKISEIHGFSNISCSDNDQSSEQSKTNEWPASKDQRDESKSQPALLLFLCPELSQSTLSLYDCFPFISYEKESLASLLKHCHSINEGVEEHLPQSLKKICQCLAETFCSDHLVLRPKDNDKSLARALSDFSSPDLHAYSDSGTYSMLEMDKLFSHLMAIHNLHIGNNQYFMSESDLQKAIAAFRDKVHGQMKFIDDDKYYKILETTGIDVDKRREWLMPYLHAMNGDLVRVIKFFRAVPGFRDFSLADRITLTRSCLPIYNLLTAHRGTDKTTYITVNVEMGIACRNGHIQKLFPTVWRIHDQMYDIADRMKALKFSCEEIVVLKAMILTTPYPEDMLEAPDIVREHHKTYQNCLLNLVRKRHGPTADSRFEEIARMFQEMNAMRDQCAFILDETRSKVLRLLDPESTPLLKEAYKNCRGTDEDQGTENTQCA